jgi:hypothetical protein
VLVGPPFLQPVSGTVQPQLSEERTICGKSPGCRGVRQREPLYYLPRQLTAFLYCYLSKVLGLSLRTARNTGQSFTKHQGSLHSCSEPGGCHKRVSEVGFLPHLVYAAGELMSTKYSRKRGFFLVQSLMRKVHFCIINGGTR